MNLFLILSIALAAPEGYKKTKEDNGCSLFLGPKQDDGVVPMRAECYWPEASLPTFNAQLDNCQDHDDIWSTVSQSDLLRTEADGSTVCKQTHSASGISDRELIVIVRHTAFQGGDRYTIDKVSDPFEVQKGNVEAVRNEGVWTALPDTSGGLRVTYELAYDPGGKVPGFIVRWFQVSGLNDIVKEMRDGLQP